MSSSQVSDEIVEAVASNEVEVELTEDGRRKSSFQLPKGRRLSRMPSSTMMNQLDNSEGKFEINKEELQAVVRNINRKEGKLKRSKQYKWALVAAIAAMAVAMACTFAVTFAAVETTKESHVSASSDMVDLKGNTVATIKATSYVKLGDLSRASIQYLSNLEDITLAANKKVHQFAVTGFTLHNSDNIDLRTSTKTVVKIQCGRVRITWDDGRVEDADEMHPDSEAASSRLLRAMSMPDIEAVFNTHVSAATRARVLAEASNPLESLYKFFGGMSKSTASSQLYGALAKKTDCPMPPALITIVRPTIPEHSKWTVEVTKEGRPDQQQPDTWYMTWNQKDQTPKLRFESPLEENMKSVVVSTAARTLFWTESDAALRTLTVADLAKNMTCPPVAELQKMSKSCEAYKAERANEMEMEYKHFSGERFGCTAKDGVDTDATLTVKIADAFADGSSVWEVGMFQMKVNSKGEPTDIAPLDKEDANSKFYKISKLEHFDPKTVDFEGCTPGEAPANEVVANKTAVAGGHGGRRLNAWTAFQAWASRTMWCGAGTDKDNTPCPLGADDGGDMACHRHDHGKKANGIIGGMAVRLGCDIDRGLADRTSNWAAQAVFGSWGLAQTWGCYDHGTYSCWNWKSKWWGGYWRYGGHCSGEHTHYGPSRYSSYSHSYGWSSQSRCSNPLSWGGI